MIVRLLLCVSLVFSFLFKESSAQSFVRDYPYPHTHIVSFTSDADMQYPWFTLGFHDYMNERLGLPISDSLWVQGSVVSLSSILQPNMALNRHSDHIGSDHSFFFLLKQWHRGNIDHFHSWQDDGLLRFTLFEEKNGLVLKEKTITINATPVLENYRSSHYTNIRFFFSEKPHDAFSIVLCDKYNRTVEISPFAIQEAFSYHTGDDQHPICINLIIDPSKNPFIVFHQKDFSLVNLKTIELRNASDKSETQNLTLFRVEIDNFSRQTVLEQYETLKKFNIGPNLLTSHGGFTVSQDICNVGTKINDKIEDCIADDKNRHAYHMDYLKKLGIKAITPLGWNNDKGFLVHNPPSKKASLCHDIYPSFYFLSRTQAGDTSDNTDLNLTPSSFTEYKILVKNLLPHISDKELNAFIDPIDDKDYNFALFNFSGGASFGVYILHAIDAIRSGQQINHQWYTHFGTISHIPQMNSTPSSPLTPALKHAGRALAEYFYNLSGTKKENERIWVTSASVYIQYMITHPYIKNNTKIDYEKSIVRIATTQDTTTGHILPDVTYGTRDLHGMTFYVKDPLSAKIYVGDKAIKTFTCNPKDHTGRPSVTIVDDHLPTEMIPTHGLIHDQGMTHTSHMTLSMEDETSLVLTSTQDGLCFMDFIPHDLSLYNISHLHLDWIRKTHPKGKVFIHITREDDQCVGLYEPSDHDNTSDAHWTNSLRGNHITLAHDQLSFNVNKDKDHNIPLTLGKIKKIRIGIKDSKKGDRLTLHKFWALQPSGTNKHSPESCVLGGQVLDKDDKPLKNYPVYATSHEHETVNTSTDQNGYFVFFDLPRGSIVSPYLKVKHKKIFPTKGQKIRLLKDDLECNISVY